MHPRELLLGFVQATQALERTRAVVARRRHRGSGGSPACPPARPRLASLAAPAAAVSALKRTLGGSHGGLLHELANQLVGDVGEPHLAGRIEPQQEERGPLLGQLLLVRTRWRRLLRSIASRSGLIALADSALTKVRFGRVAHAIVERSHAATRPSRCGSERLGHRAIGDLRDRLARELDGARLEQALGARQCFLVAERATVTPWLTRAARRSRA